MVAMLVSPIGGRAAAGGPKFSPAAMGGHFCGIRPWNEVPSPKLKYEALQTMEVFINLYSIVSCNL